MPRKHGIIAGDWISFVPVKTAVNQTGSNTAGRSDPQQDGGTAAGSRQSGASLWFLSALDLGSVCIGSGSCLLWTWFLPALDLDAGVLRWSPSDTVAVQNLLPLHHPVSLQAQLASQLRREFLTKGGGNKEAETLYHNQEVTITMATDRCPAWHPV